MDDLLTFIRAQLDEDERVAREAAFGGAEWSVITFDLGTEVAVRRAELDPVITADGHPSRDDAEHIARFDPARVLAEIEAKRARIGLLELMLDADPQDETADMARVLLRFEAQPYAGQPGWREEWRV